MTGYPSTPPARAVSVTGLMAHRIFTIHGARIALFIDWVKLPIVFPHPLQPGQIKKYFSKDWDKLLASGLIELTPADRDITGVPRTANQPRNTFTRYYLTLHEPHTWFCRRLMDKLEELQAVLNVQYGAVVPREWICIEYGVDIWHDGSILDSADFAALFLSRLKHDLGIGEAEPHTAIPPTGSQLARNPRQKWSKAPIDGGSYGIVNTILDGLMVYVGDMNQKQLRSYFKKTDRHAALPPDQYRLRFEVRAIGDHCPVDVLSLLKGSTSAANKLARCFAADIPATALQSAMRLCVGVSSVARGVKYAGHEELAKLKSKFKRCGKGGSATLHTVVDTAWNQEVVNGFVALARSMGRENRRAHKLKCAPIAVTSITTKPVPIAVPALPEVATTTAPECAAFTVTSSTAPAQQGIFEKARQKIRATMTAQRAKQQALREIMRLWAEEETPDQALLDAAGVGSATEGESTITAAAQQEVNAEEKDRIRVLALSPAEQEAELFALLDQMEEATIKDADRTP